MHMRKQKDKLLLQFSLNAQGLPNLLMAFSICLKETNVITS